MQSTNDSSEQTSRFDTNQLFLSQYINVYLVWLRASQSDKKK